jgi:two-component system response regulator YesN
MYKFLLIDDEAIVREGIRDNIKWAEHGFEFVGACADGREGIASVERLHPDVILTDICMPFVNGLELTKIITSRYPDIKVLLLTGHDEFEYAREAVKLKADDFILKPITAAELRKILDRVRRELDKERREKQSYQRLKEQLKESLPLLRERFLNRLVSGNLENIDPEARMAVCGITLQGNLFQILLIDPDSDSHGAETDLHYLAVRNICNNMVKGNGRSLCFQDSNDRIVVIIAGHDSAALKKETLERSEKINLEAKKHPGIILSAGIGNPVTHISAISSSYKEALLALEYRFLIGRGLVIQVNEVLGSEKGIRESGKKWNRDLARTLRLASGRQADSIITGMISDFRKAAISREKFSIEIHKTLSYILRTVEEIGIEEKEILVEGNENPFSIIDNCKTLEEIEIWCKELCRNIISCIASRRENHSRMKALEAEHFIIDHFREQDLYLSAVCKAIAVSSSYFSPLFKKYTGKTFVEYLTAKRIEKAGELLRCSDLKQYEIADAVGFNDPHYFSIIFKKITGLPPSEYRKQVLP